MSWLILVDQEKDFSNADTIHKVMTTRDYLSRPQLFKNQKAKVINLARSYSYQGFGYYCALLAEARGHRIMPNVEVMTELTKKTLYEHAIPDLEAQLNRAIEKLPKGEVVPAKLFVCFGQCESPAFQSFSRNLFDWFRVPMLRVVLATPASGRTSTRQIERIVPVAINTLTAAERAVFAKALEAHTRGTWKKPKARSVSKYSLAVLTDPTDPIPPSDQGSLRYFAKIAEKMGIEVEPILRNELNRLAEFDALFIRVTTSMDNYTYRFARRAQQEGMVVIDDPQSMIRCTNKVYLAERLEAAGIPMPQTMIVQSEKQAAEIGDKLGYPVVIKSPDGSFSRGVFKCNDEPALKTKLKELLADSDLVIAQQFVPTAFDWRIGVLDGKALFAAQYLMAKNHWQVMKHDGKKSIDGGFKAVKLTDVPLGVIETAVAAANLMGTGLYGVDLKQTDDGLVVIEVNDNPDLNHGVEDAAEKDAVWERIVQWFWDRLEAM
ncbi:MAG: RimK family protein [Deltaproteobacteria bacterium]|nr:RimK family protein [Deltaproteobacteria bacterium]